MSMVKKPSIYKQLSNPHKYCKDNPKNNDATTDTATVDPIPFWIPLTTTPSKASAAAESLN